MQLHKRAQPILGDFRLARVAQQLEALEHVGEHLIEAVEVALVLDEGRARQVVEVLDLALGQVGLQRLDQRQVFLQGDRHLGGF